MFKGHRKYLESNTQSTDNLDKIIEELNIKLSQVMKENEFLKAENNKIQRMANETQTKYVTLQQKYKNLKIRFRYLQSVIPSQKSSDIPLSVSHSKSDIHLTSSSGYQPSFRTPKHISNPLTISSNGELVSQNSNSLNLSSSSSPYDSPRSYTPLRFDKSKSPRPTPLTNVVTPNKCPSTLNNGSNSSPKDINNNKPNNGSPSSLVIHKDKDILNRSQNISISSNIQSVITPLSSSSPTISTTPSISTTTTTNSTANTNEPTSSISSLTSSSSPISSSSSSNNNVRPPPLKQPQSQHLKSYNSSTIPSLSLKENEEKRKMNYLPRANSSLSQSTFIAESPFYDTFLVLGVDINNFTNNNKEKNLNGKLLFQYPKDNIVPDELSRFVFTKGIKSKEIPSTDPNKIIKLLEQNIKPTDEKYIIMLTNVNSDKQYGICTICNEIYYNNNDNKYYIIPMAYIILSSIPAFTIHFDVLNHLVSYYRQNVYDSLKSTLIPATYVIETILITLTTRYSNVNDVSTNNILSVYRSININGKKDSIQISLHPSWPKLTLHLSEGPKDVVYHDLILSFKGYELFQTMSVGDILLALGCLLTEQYVILICKDSYKLTRYFLYFLSLLYPFQWVNPAIPLIPYGNNLFLFESPVHIFIGVNEELSLFKDHDDFVIIDLDSSLQKVTIQNGNYHTVKLPFMNELSFSLEDLMKDINNEDKNKRNECFLKIVKRLRDYMTMLYDAAEKVNKHYDEIQNDDEHVEISTPLGVVQDSDIYFFRGLLDSQLFAGISEKNDELLIRNNRLYSKYIDTSYIAQLVSSTAAGRLQEDNDKFDEDGDDFAFNQDLMNSYVFSPNKIRARPMSFSTST